jgi:acid phosphatase class B
MSDILDEVLLRIQKSLESDHKVLTIFDLDSTLFDVSPRLEKILMEFAEVPEHQRRFPEHIPYFKNIRTHRTDWGIRKTLIRAGLTHAEPEFQDAVRDFWRQRFFSNEYLEYDVPYEGAAEYVQEVHNLGSKVFYLTGRDQHRMGAGSRKVLQKWDFPLNDQSAHLVLKPEKGMDDGLFKRDWFLQHPPHEQKALWFFENEPVNVNLVKKHSPHVEIIFFDSTHQGAEEPPPDIPKIMNFLCKVAPANSPKDPRSGKT